MEAHNIHTTDAPHQYGTTVDRKNLSILASPPKTIKKRTKEDLFLEGYGRQWGEKLTYSVGLCYATGILLGGSYGVIVGLRKGGSTPRLLLNSILNGTTTYGPLLGNQAAAISLFHCTFCNLYQLASGQDNIGISTLAGASAGALYKVKSGWRPVLRYTLCAAGIFGAVDGGFRYGWL